MLKNVSPKASIIIGIAVLLVAFIFIDEDAENNLDDFQHVTRSSILAGDVS